MIVGCFIAGSTPLGGAITAFPVAVLILQLTPEQGRDFAALIQSVGMTAAAYLIVVSKPHLVQPAMILVSVLTGTLGVILGLELDLGKKGGFIILCTYTTLVTAFAIGYLYIKIAEDFYEPDVVEEARGKANNVKNAVPKMLVGSVVSNHIADDSAVIQSSASPDGRDRINADQPIAVQSSIEIGKEKNTKLVLAAFAIGGFIGGILTSKIGSGSDTIAYVLGVMVWNPFMKNARMPESMMTASSVIIMSILTCVVSVCRVLTGTVHRDVFLCWGATLPIVVAGAPLGSMVLNKFRETIFRRLFYILALIQFVTVGIIKVKTNLVAWIAIAVFLLLVCLALTIHYFFILRHKKYAPDFSALLESIDASEDVTVDTKTRRDGPSETPRDAELSGSCVCV
jgi:uncharacterized membrane protein YfcA